MHKALVTHVIISSHVDTPPGKEIATFASQQDGKIQTNQYGGKITMWETSVTRGEAPNAQRLRTVDRYSINTPCLLPQVY